MPTTIAIGEFYTDGKEMRKVDKIVGNRVDYTNFSLTGEKRKGNCKAENLIKWAKGTVQRYVKVKIDEDEWELKSFMDLKKGDYFKIFDPDGAKLIHETGDTWIATEDAKELKGTPCVETKRVDSEVVSAE